MSLDANYGIARPVEGGGVWGAAAPHTILSFHRRQASPTQATSCYFGFVCTATPPNFCTLGQPCGIVSREHDKNKLYVLVLAYSRHYNYGNSKYC